MNQSLRFFIGTKEYLFSMDFDALPISLVLGSSKALCISQRFLHSAPGTASSLYCPDHQLESSVPLETVFERWRANHGLHDDIPPVSPRSVQTSGDSKTHHVILSKRKCKINILMTLRGSLLFFVYIHNYPPDFNESNPIIEHSKKKTIRQKNSYISNFAILVSNLTKQYLW